MKQLSYSYALGNTEFKEDIQILHLQAKNKY